MTERTWYVIVVDVRHPAVREPQTVYGAQYAVRSHAVEDAIEEAGNNLLYARDRPGRAEPKEYRKSDPNLPLLPLRVVCKQNWEVVWQESDWEYETIANEHHRMRIASARGGVAE